MRDKSRNCRHRISLPQNAQRLPDLSGLPARTRLLLLLIRFRLCACRLRYFRCPRLPAGRARTNGRRRPGTIPFARRFRSWLSKAAICSGVKFAVNSRHLGKLDFAAYSSAFATFSANGNAGVPKILASGSGSYKDLSKPDLGGVRIGEVR